MCKMCRTHRLLTTVLCVGRVLRCQVVSWLRWLWLYKCVNFFLKLVSVVYTWIRKYIFTDTHTHTVTELALTCCYSLCSLFVDSKMDFFPQWHPLLLSVLLHCLHNSVIMKWLFCRARCIITKWLYLSGQA